MPASPSGPLFRAARIATVSAWSSA
jgi:hypothetical protein